VGEKHKEPGNRGDSSGSGGLARRGTDGGHRANERYPKRCDRVSLQGCRLQFDRTAATAAIRGSALRIRLGAIPARSVDPVLLDQVVARRERYVVLGTVTRGARGTESPRALIRVLVTAPVVPRVEIGIGHRF